MAVKTRTTCPHCGRVIALIRDGVIARHGRHHRPACPGSNLTAIDGPLTDKQLQFIRHCWTHGDALPVARLFGTEYPTPNVPHNLDADAALVLLTIAARAWIEDLHRDYTQGVPA